MPANPDMTKQLLEMEQRLNKLYAMRLESESKRKAETELVLGEISNLQRRDRDLVNDLEGQLRTLNAALKQIESLKAIEKTYESAEKLMKSAMGRLNDIEQVIAKVEQSKGIAKDLTSAEAQSKMALGRANALATQVDQLMKDRVTAADLKALEKRLTDLIKKK